MKIIFCLVALALSTFVTAHGHSHHQQRPSNALNENSPSFFIGQWYPVNFDEDSVKNDKCCMPVENIRFVHGAQDFLVLEATKWVGKGCDGVFSFGQSQRFRTGADTSYSKVSNGYTNSDKAFQMDAKKASFGGVHANNGTQKITFELTLNYKQRAGSSCTMTLSKAETPVIAQPSVALRGSHNSHKESFNSEDNADFGFFDLVEEFFRRPGKDIFWD